MKSFREFLMEHRIDETIVRKGAVAAYASKGRTHGDRAEQHYREAKRLLTINIQNKKSDQKIDLMMSAMSQLADGLISSRHQLGSVSAQITSLSLL